MSFKETPNVLEFLSTNISKVLREDLGVKSFKEVEQNFREIYVMIEEMITIASSNSIVANGLVNQVYHFVNDFNQFSKSFVDYNIDHDGANSFRNRQRLIDNFNSWYNSIFSGVHENKPMFFLQVYNSIKITNLLSLQTDKIEIERYKMDLSEIQTKAEEMITLLQTQLSKQTVQDYAKIFHNQASKHSDFKISIKPLKIKFGNAQIWLLISTILIIAFGFLAYNMNYIFPIDKAAQPTIITIQMLTRLLFISVAFYIISFSLKQYNVQNHLATLNRHRQNTLNSYNLFISSLDSNDATVRNALMMEVAKAIYEAGSSGYISNKDSSESTPSIIEMTRFVGKNN